MRFVLLSHTGWPGHPDHLDLLLQVAPATGEDDRVLLSFASEATSPVEPARAGVPQDEPVVLPPHWRRQADHRYKYLGYTGPVSGGRGHVARLDEGAWQLLSEETGRGHVLCFRLHGRRVAGGFRLAAGPDGRYTLDGLSEDSSEEHQHGRQTGVPT